MATDSTAKLANSELNSHYQKFLTALPNQQIERAPIATQEQSIGSISDQVKAYLEPYYKNAISQRQAQTKQYQAEIDADAMSRGMGASSYVTDMKNRQYASEASDVSNLNNQYSSTLAQNVASTYENYLNRKASVDEINAGNQIEVDKWNAAAKLSLEQLAYNRALQEYARAEAERNKGGGGRKTGGDEVVVTGDIGSSIYDPYAYTRSYAGAKNTLASSVISAYNNKNKK